MGSRKQRLKPNTSYYFKWATFCLIDAINSSPDRLHVKPLGFVSSCVAGLDFPPVQVLLISAPFVFLYLNHSARAVLHFLKSLFIFFRISAQAVSELCFQSWIWNLCSKDSGPLLPLLGRFRNDSKARIWRRFCAAAQRAILSRCYRRYFDDDSFVFVNVTLFSGFFFCHWGWRVVSLLACAVTWPLFLHTVRPSVWFMSEEGQWGEVVDKALETGSGKERGMWREGGAGQMLDPLSEVGSIQKET